MEFRFTQTIEHIDHAALLKLKSDPNGPVGRDLLKKAYKLAALARADAPKKTGRLAASIRVIYTAGPDPWVTIGSDLSYAKDVHDGTRPHLIHPSKARVLRFVSRGRVIYAREVHHPGTRANPFLARHLRKVM